MSPGIICLPAPEASRSAVPSPPPRAQALSEGLLTSLEPAYWRPFCLGRICLETNSCKSAWESDGIWAVGTWSPGKEGWGDLGMGDGGSLKHTSWQQQVPFSSSLGLNLLPPLLPTHSHSGTETRGPTSKGPLFPFPLPLSSLRPLSPHLCTAGSFSNRLSFPSRSPLCQSVPSCCSPSLATLPPWLLNLPSPPGSATFPAVSLAEVTRRSRESQSLTCRSGSWGPLVPRKRRFRRSHRPALDPAAGIMGPCSRLAGGMVGGGGMGPLSPNVHPAACPRVCRTTVENESLGLEGLKNQQASCRCCERAKSVHYTGFLKEWSMPQLYWGHPCGAC